MGNGTILKNLNAVLSYSTQRFRNEFKWQDIVLNESFKISFREYLENKKCSIEYLEHTSVITTKAGQNIFVANQWFAIGSYFVDFCTELLTYRVIFLCICKMKNLDPVEYAKRLKLTPSVQDKSFVIAAAKEVFQLEYKNASGIDEAANLFWKFVSDYSWWAGSKSIDRNDFFVSPVLNSLNIVNVSHGFVADIVIAYATDYRLRTLVESLENFVVRPQLNVYTPSEEEKKSYQLAEGKDLQNALCEKVAPYDGERECSPTISISLASLARFKNNGV